MSDFKSGQKVRLHDEDNVPYSGTNPLPVNLVASEAGVEIHDFNDNGAVDVVVDNSVNHDYTVTAAKTFLFEQVIFSSSGASKVEVQVETGVGAGTFDTIAVGFVQAGQQKDEICFKKPKRVAAGVIVRVVKTNNDNDDQCLYSTIVGIEV